MNRLILLFVLVTVIFGCRSNVYDESIISNPKYLHEAQQKYSDIIVYDIFSPPVASRNYAYASIAAYEVLAQKDSIYKSLAGQLSDLDAIPEAPDQSYSVSLAALEAFYQTAKHFIFSEDKLIDHRKETLEKIKKESGISGAILERSLAHGAATAAHIIAWSDGDLYKHCLLYTSPSPRDQRGSRMPSSA